MKKFTLILFILFSSCLMTSTAVSRDLSKSYVSLNGKFYFNFPAAWHQVPYIEVDRYLASKNAGRPLFNYEVVVAPKAAAPFFSEEYLFITIDTIGQLTDNQIDSVINDLQKTFGKDIKYYPVSDFMVDIKTDEPNYDKDKKIVTILNTIVQNENTVKVSLLMMKFYEQGIVNFYFYCPETAFEKNKALFNSIISTFDTENINAQLPKENLKVADIDVSDTDENKNNGESDSNSTTAVFVVLAIVVFIAIRRKRKKNS